MSEGNPREALSQLVFGHVAARDYAVSRDGGADLGDVKKRSTLGHCEHDGAARPL